MFAFIDCFIMLVSCNDICVNISTKYSDSVIAKGLLMCNGGSLQFSMLLHFWYFVLCITDVGSSLHGILTGQEKWIL